MTVSIVNATPPKSTKSTIPRISDFSASQGTNSNREFGFSVLSKSDVWQIQIGILFFRSFEIRLAFSNWTTPQDVQTEIGRTPKWEVRFVIEETSDFTKRGENRGKSGSLQSVGTVVRPLWRAARARTKAPVLATRLFEFETTILNFWIWWISGV